MKWIAIGAVFAGLGVAMGAFGAHGLDKYFVKKYGDWEPKTVAGREMPASYKYLQDFKTGVRYHMYHALGLIAVGLVALRRKSKALSAAGVFFVLGILLFSGSLYLLTIFGPYWLGVIWGLVAAVGGTFMICGWIAFAVGTCACGSDAAAEG